VSNWLVYLSLLLSLGSIAFSYLMYRRMNAMKTKAAAPDSGKRVTNSTEENQAMYKRMENKLYEEINRLTRSFDEKLAAITFSASSAAPATPEPTPATSSYAPYTPATPAYTAPQPIVEPEPEPVHTPEPAAYTPPAYTPPAAPTVVHVLDETADMDEEEEEDEDDDRYKAPENYTTPSSTPATQDVDDLTADISAPAAIGYSAAQSAEIPAFTSHPAPDAGHDTDEDDEDGEATPYYKYASLPENDFFPEEELKDAPEKDSIFEVELYEDVPNKAFFSLLPYPEVIRKALSDPDRYLKPCCSYTDDPTGKRTIVLIEEGMLRRQQDKWLIFEKARIRFE
jgi:hypothetical protein